ncbi:MAG: C-GCAxxG-C-C family protein [Coriobacteriia bacterium]|nr:C-GCAxxG-C-C family protein [Coriobacteriia bacterium]
MDLQVRDVRDSCEPLITVTPGCRADALAASYYQSGLHCGEAVVRAVNEVAGTPMPPEVFRMASGFCEGISGSRCTCGAMAGGVMAMGLVGGRTGSEQPWEPIWEATATLRSRFAQDQGTTLCDPISESHGGMDHPLRWAHCTELVGRTARWVVEIAEENDWL